jgi:uncharacterized protein YdaU (DUF1376 family)
MKDPAFLFYSKDFYEGTRMMLPAERACYIDLIIYQHQNGPIPDDLERLMLYCSGINEATLKATLKAKFKLTDKGWLNIKLDKVINERRIFSEKQSVNGRVGQFFKKSKRILTPEQYDELRKHFVNQSNNEIYEKIKDIDFSKSDGEAMLKALLKHLAIAIANENSITVSANYPNYNEGQNFDFFILQKNTQWIESVYSQLVTSKGISFSYERFTNLLKDFCTERSLTGEPPKNEYDYRSHFVNWAKIQVNKPQTANSREGLPRHLQLLHT